jgi:hypothetical protein
MASVGATQDDKHPDCILVDILHCTFGVQAIVSLLRDRDKTAFDIKVARKLLKSDLGIGTHDDVWAGFVNALASCLALLLPDPFHGEPTELYGLG